MDDLSDILNFSANKTQDPISPLMSMADQGQQALASGEISKKEAKAAQKKLGIDSPQGAQDFLSTYLFGGGQPQNPYVFGGDQPAKPTPLLDPSQVPNVAGVKPGQRGAQIKSQQTASQDNSQHKTRNSYDGAEDIISMARNLPEIQAQEKGIHNLEDQLAMVKNKSNPNDSWVRPFLALSDAQSGGHQADYFMPAQEKKDAALQKFANEIQQRRGDLSKTILDSITKLKTGSDQSASTQKLNEMIAMGIGGGANGALGEVRRNNAIVAAGASFDKDSLLKQMQGTNNSLDRALSIMDGSTPVTGKNFALLQQDMINAMAPGGAATEGKVNREMVETLEAELNNLKTKFGNISDLRKDQPQIFAQLRGLVEQVKHDYNSAYSQRVGDLRKNFDLVPDETIKKAAYDKADHLTSQLTTGKKAVASKPKTVTQKGHTFTLNETTGEYE